MRLGQDLSKIVLLLLQAGAGLPCARVRVCARGCASAHAGVVACVVSRERIGYVMR
jgi:hypothetical protein